MAAVTVHETDNPNVWIVDIGERIYRAAYLDSPDVFPLDRWMVRNAWRRRYLPWDSPTLRRVVYAVRAHVAAQRAAAVR